MLYKNQVSNSFLGIIGTKYFTLILYLIIIGPLLFIHSTFEEWDGVMHYFGGIQLLDGLGYCGWESKFWPPLFSIFVGLNSRLFEGFLGAKLISFFSGGLLIFIAYDASFELFKDKKLSILSQIFLLLNPYFILSSIQADNHMFEALLFGVSILCFIKGSNKNDSIKFIFSGFFLGLACLTRYTSYIFFPVGMLSIILIKNKQLKLKALPFFLFSFILVSLPWWLYNNFVNGSPFENWQYLNSWASVSVIEGINNSWINHNEIDGFLDIFAKMPISYLKNIKNNIIFSFYILFTSLGSLFLISLASFLESIKWISPRLFFIIFGSIFFQIFVLSNAFIIREAFLAWTIYLIPICLVWLKNYAYVLKDKFFLRSNINYSKILFSVFIFLNIGFSIVKTIDYLSDYEDGGQLSDFREVTKILKQENNIQDKFIMATHPARAYYLESGYLYFPSNYQGEIQGITSYKGLSDKIISSFPKYPSNCKNKKKYKADYVIFSRNLKEHRPDFKFLFEKNTSKIPENFINIYLSENTAVYRID